MSVTMVDMQPVGMCLATQDLFDAKRFQRNFCDTLLMRVRDKGMEEILVSAKRELNASATEKKFLDGYKVVIVNNIDKILSLVASRYAQIDYRTVEEIVASGKDLMKRVMFSDNFGHIAALESIFKSKVSLPTYHLFIEYMKRAKV
jgi:hypothetical protein